MEADIFFYRKMSKVLVQQALGEFHFPLSPEIVENDVISIPESADGGSLLIDQNPGL
jgi:hypothetical protein